MEDWDFPVWILFCLTAICVGSLLLSYVAFRRGSTRSADDYFVAGSSLGYFVLIFSMLASFLSAFCMFGMSSLGYRTGFGALFVLTVNLVPLGFFWYFMHRKTFILGKARRWMSMGPLRSWICAILSRETVESDPVLKKGRIFHGSKKTCNLR